MEHGPVVDLTEHWMSLFIHAISHFRGIKNTI